jgi:hypothetical protein
VFRCPETEQLVAEMTGAVRVVVFDQVRQLSSSTRGHPSELKPALSSWPFGHTCYPNVHQLESDRDSQVDRDTKENAR